jgi:hypothetical protein
MSHKEEEELNIVGVEISEDEVDILATADDLDDPLDDEVLDDELLTDDDIVDEDETDDFVGLDGSSDY